MKKLFLSSEKRGLNQRHALDSALRSIEFKKRKRRQRRLSQSCAVQRDALGVLISEYKRVVAPEHFTFLENPEGVVHFIVQLEEYFAKRQKVWIVLRKVNKVDDAALVVLLAVMVKFKSNDIQFNGDFPKDRTAKTLLIRSGFFTNLMKEFEIEERYHLNTDASHRIHTHAWKNVDPALSASLIGSAAQHIWGAKQRCLGVQRVMLELMQNTNNHAEIGKIGEKHWWLSVHHSKDQKRVCFSFVDFGVGVFTSLNNKPEQSKWHNWAEKLKERFYYGDNADLLRLILAGELHRTATGKPYRGKGLPGIAAACKRNHIKRLHILTNNVYCLYDDNRYKILPVGFNGTLVCWEVTDANEHLPDY